MVANGAGVLASPKREPVVERAAAEIVAEAWILLRTEIRKLPGFHVGDGDGSIAATAEAAYGMAGVLFTTAGCDFGQQHLTLAGAAAALAGAARLFLVPGQEEQAAKLAALARDIVSAWAGAPPPCPAVADCRLTAWRDESNVLPRGGLAWRRYWTVGSRYRAAVVYDTLQSKNGPRRPPYTWCASPVTGKGDVEGKAGSLVEACEKADEALLGFHERADLGAVEGGA